MRRVVAKYLRRLATTRTPIPADAPPRYVRNMLERRSILYRDLKRAWKTVPRPERRRV
jgi:hypothetical protein